MTHKQLTPSQKYEILYLCTEYVKPEQIKSEFGITYTTLNHYCKEYKIPKWQKSYSVRRKECLEEFKDNEEYEKALRIRLARETFE